MTQNKKYKNKISDIKNTNKIKTKYQQYIDEI